MNQYPYGSPYTGDLAAYAPPPPPPRRPRRRRGLVSAGIGLVAAAAVIGGVAIGESVTSTTAGSGSLAQGGPTTPTIPTDPGSGLGLPGTGSGHGHGNGTTSVSLATKAQKRGVVTIVSVLKYQNAESAGTGMVLSANGEVLTNNHVVDGATSVTATVASTGKSYRAEVVGTDPSDDVAVLQLRNATGLTTASVGDSSGVGVGDSAIGVGNAGGTGTLRASHGSVVGLDKSITATDESGQNAERLTGLIQIDAPIVAGDSGGPLYDSSGDIVGMDTAAATNGGRQVQTASTAYAIPIDSALQVASQIENGTETGKIHIGLPAFLGVSVANANGQGAAVVPPLLGAGPAATAGITPGSVITAVGGKQVSSAASLRTVLSGFNPGQRTTVAWTDAAGASHSATVTLATGPAD